MWPKSLIGKILVVWCFWPILAIWILAKFLYRHYRARQTTARKARDPRAKPTQTTHFGDALQPAHSGQPSGNDQLIKSLQIPEPTRSLLFVTDENPEKIQSPLGMTIGIGIDSSTGKVTASEEEKGFYAEPSLIWTKLAVKPNNWLEKKAMYWPVYAQFSPEHRYQYLCWLKNIEQPANLSYVFLYFYGLERHMLVGNYDRAVDEIVRLLRAHDKSSFRAYATRSLIVASLVRNRLDIIEKSSLYTQRRN